MSQCVSTHASYSGGPFLFSIAKRPFVLTEAFCLLFSPSRQISG
jgi:hypothetical protein